MSEPVFLPSIVQVTLEEAVAITGAFLAEDANGERRFGGVAALDEAGPGDISFLDARSPDVGPTRAGVCLVAAADRHKLPSSTIALITDDPGGAFAALVSALYPGVARPTSLFATRGISPAAFIHAEARLEADVTVDPGVVIGPRAEVGSGTVIGANSVIGPQVRIGRNCAIGAQVTLTNVLLGNAVIIHPGACIGQDGPQDGAAGLRRVIIQDGVEIGANAAVDRGGLSDTVLGEGCRIGPLTHVERGRAVERHAILTASGLPGR